MYGTGNRALRHVINLQRVLDHAMTVDRPLPEVVSG